MDKEYSRTQTSSKQFKMPCLESLTEVRVRRFLEMAIGPELQRTFVTAKQGIVVALQKLAYFQSFSAVPIAVSCDASLLGLGAMLWQ